MDFLLQHIVFSAEDGIFDEDAGVGVICGSDMRNGKGVVDIGHGGIGGMIIGFLFGAAVS